MLDEAVDQWSRTGGQVLRHGFAGKLAVVLGQRRQHAAMVSYRLVWPAGDGGEHGFRRVAGDLRHQLSQLGRSGGDVDGPMKLMVETNCSLVVTAGIGFLKLGLNLLELPQLVVVDVDRGPRGELAADVRLDVGDV